MTNNSAQDLGGREESEESYSQSQQDWWRYFTFNKDHKVIGVQYLTTAFAFFLLGGVLAMLIRAELLTPPLAVTPYLAIGQLLLLLLVWL